MIIRNKQRLDISYVPQKIPCREREIERLELLMKSNGKALISGDIGTGKTLLAKHSAKDGVYVNCFINRSEHTILENILSQIKPNFNTAGMPSRKLWNQITSNSMIVIDEVEGIIIDELTPFLYTLSRQAEQGDKINYIAITRDENILRQMINDDATWSTFAEKSVIHLESYTHDEMVKILKYRAEDTLYPKSFDEEILSLIADIAINSRGHMRTAIDLLRNSAILAESKGKDKIEAEDVREVNMEDWSENLTELSKNHILTLLSVAMACKNKTYSTIDQIESIYKIKCEEYKEKPADFKNNLGDLEKEGIIQRRENRYTILYPSSTFINRLENILV